MYCGLIIYTTNICVFFTKIYFSLNVTNILLKISLKNAIIYTYFIYIL